MNQFCFRDTNGKEIAPDEWLRLWSRRYPSDDDPEYFALIAKNQSLSAADFERIGRWKDGAQKDGRWKPNVASVGYPIWMQAASELPRCPDEARLSNFLHDWS